MQRRHQKSARQQNARAAGHCTEMPRVPPPPTPSVEQPISILEQLLGRKEEGVTELSDLPAGTLRTSR